MKRIPATLAALVGVLAAVFIAAPPAGAAATLMELPPPVSGPNFGPPQKAATGSPQPLTTTWVWGVNFDHWWSVTHPGSPASYAVSSLQGWRSTGGPPYLVFQSDCNLVERGDNGQALWDSGTWNLLQPCRLEFQTDANVVIYNANHTARWDTGQTWGNTHSANFSLFAAGGCLQEDDYTAFPGSIRWRNFAGCQAS